MSTDRVIPIDQPRPFGREELFFSLTDPKGKIRYGNEVFTRVSGYPEEQLVGAPHSVIRHPDMPRCVFQLLWDTIKAGQTIAAYVKNMAADGTYYWVLATVFPCPGGYLSVRLNPSSPLFDAARELYAEALTCQREHELQRGRSEAMAVSGQQLLDRLAELGFASYADFMREALVEELRSRAGLPPREQDKEYRPDHDTGLVLLGQTSRRVVETLHELFASLEVFSRLNAKLSEKQSTMSELGPSLAFLALNAHVASSRMGSEGAVLSVVSRELSLHAKLADQRLVELMQKIEPLCKAARELAFNVAVAQLESEVFVAYARELDTESLREESTFTALNTLQGDLSDRCCTAMAGLSVLASDLSRVQQIANDLIGHVGQMKVTQLNGKIEIAGRRDAAGFIGIFEDVATIVAEARGDCDAIVDVVDDARASIAGLLELEKRLTAELADVASATNTLSMPLLEGATC